MVNTKKLKYNSKRNIGLILIICIIFGGYVFFFSTPMMFKTSKDELLLTPIDKTITINSSHSVTVEDWQYSPDDKKMEVILSFDSSDNNPSEKYVYQVVSRNVYKNEKSVEYNVTYQSSTFASIMITEVPSDFSEMALYVGYIDKHAEEKNSEENTEAAFTTLYTNKYAVQETEEIEPMSILQLYIDKLDKNISGFEDEIEELENENSDLNVKKQDILQRVAELKESETYMTKADAEKVEEQIDSFETTYKSHESIIKSNEEKIDELKEKISDAEEKKSELEDIKVDKNNK